MKYRWIQRVDDVRTSTYCWKVAIKRKNIYRHKYFSDNIFGSKEAALEAAIAYRDALVKEFSGVDYELWKREFIRPTNTSGIPGVARYVMRSHTKQCKDYEHWLAFWRDADGKRRSRAFSVDKYGEVGAKERACEARQEGLKAVEEAFTRQLQQIESEEHLQGGENKG